MGCVDRVISDSARRFIEEVAAARPAEGSYFHDVGLYDWVSANRGLEKSYEDLIKVAKKQKMDDPYFADKENKRLNRNNARVYLKAITTCERLSRMYPIRYSEIDEAYDFYSELLRKPKVESIPGHDDHGSQ